MAAICWVDFRNKSHVERGLHIGVQIDLGEHVLDKLVLGGKHDNHPINYQVGLLPVIRMVISYKL